MELSEDQNYVENVRNLLQNVNDAFPGNQNDPKMTQIQPKMPNSNPKIHKNPKNGHKMFFGGVGGASEDSALDSAKKIMNLVDNRTGQNDFGEIVEIILPTYCKERIKPFRLWVSFCCD